MNKEVKSGNPLSAQKPSLAPTKTEALKTPTPAVNHLVKTNANQQTPSTGQAAVQEESSSEFAVWRSSRQIMEEFPVSEKSLYNWRQAGILPFGLLGRKIMYNRTLIEKILKSRWNVGLVLGNLFLDFFPIY